MKSDRKVSRRYAEAIFSLARDQGRLDDLQAELAAANRLLAEAPDLRALLDHPEIAREQKLSLLEAAFAGRFSPELVSFLRLLVLRRRQNLLPEMEEEFAALADEARAVVRARVESAIPLAPEQRTRLRDKLAAMTGKRVELEEEVAPALLAGLRVWLGDRMIDGSAARRLAELRATLLALRGAPR